MNSLLVKGVFQILLAFNIPIIALGQVAIGADDLLFDQESGFRNVVEHRNRVAGFVDATPGGVVCKDIGG